jgi:hypothetical protein
MSITLDADGGKDVTLNATQAQVILSAGGNRVTPEWLVIRGTGTAVTVYIEAGGALTDAASTGSAGDRKWDRAVAADGEEWVWIRGTEVAISGSAATAVSIQVG